MTTKNKTGILIGVVCIVIGFTFCPAAGSKSNENISEVRKELLQSVSEVKKGNKEKKGQLVQIMNALGRGNRKFASEELLPDYISFLKDKNGEVQ